MKKVFSIMSNIQTYCHLKIDIQIVDQHAGGKLSIHGIKHRKGNQLQCPELPCFLVENLIMTQRVRR